MSREHRHAQRSPDTGGAAESGGRDLRQMAMMQRAHDRRKAAGQSNVQSSAAIAEARHELKDKVGAQLRETMYAALDVFQSMVRADDRHEVEVSIGFGKAVGEKVTDWLQDKALDVVKESFELGETVVGGSISTVFGAAKGRLESVADAGAKIRASEAVDKIVGEARAVTDRACHAAEAAVDRMSDEKMAEVAGILETFEGIKDASDNEREGTLRHGLQNWLMEQMGAPATGGKAIHEHAVELYEVYRQEVRRTLPVKEQVGEIDEAKSGKLHGHAEEEAAKAEERLGDAGEVERDTNERKRVEAL